MITYAYTILYVHRVRQSLAFYEAAFGLTIKFMTPEEDYGELLTGTTTLAFASHGLAETNLADGFTRSDPAKQPAGFEIAFATADVNGAVEKALQAGAVLAAAPRTKPWGQVVAYVRDIDGFLVEICTPVN